MTALRWTRVAAALLAVAAALAGGCKKKTQAGLVIVSPHNKKIEAEFEAAFRAWHQEQFGQDVKIEWRDIGGTTLVTRFLIEQYKRSDSSGIDLYFGGGAPDHERLADREITVPVQLPEEILAKLPRTIGPVLQYDPAGHWYGATVSSFGIIYNAKLLREKSLPIPRHWDDLASPAMYRKVAAAKAAQSGSARAAYEMIIQSEPNWPAGWAKLLKIFANCKRFTSGASDIPADVANGEVLAGAAIDFYAYLQIAASGAETVGFTMVPETTAFTPDPISMLKGAPHPVAAQRFIEFVLSERGQTLWCLPPGTPGGPIRDGLYRQPIRRDIYDKYAERMFAPLVNPFEQDWDFQLDKRAAGIRISRLLGPLMTAATDLQPDLPKAWKAIIDAGMPADLLKEFAALPDDLAEEATALETAGKLSDARQRELITSDWRQFFRAKYEKIIEQATGR